MINEYGLTTINGDELKSKTKSYTIVEIEKEHLKHLKIMVLSMFPVDYNNTFYQDVLKWPVKRMVFERNTPIGAVCATIEDVDGKQKMYIAILGVMVFWRRCGVGKLLLECVEDYCKLNSSISAIYLHTQKDNLDAYEFYSRFGFVVTNEIENYYRRTSCPTAITMEKTL